VEVVKTAVGTAGKKKLGDKGEMEARGGTVRLSHDPEMGKVFLYGAKVSAKVI